MKRGQTESYSFLIGMIITIAIIVVLILFFSGFFSGEKEQELSEAEHGLENITGFYKACLENPKTDCLCGSFDISRFRQIGYSLFLIKMLGKSNLVLTEFGDYPNPDGAIDPDVILAKSAFDEQLVCTFEYDGFKLTDVAQRFFDFNSQKLLLYTNGMVTVLKTDSKACIVDSQAVEKIYGAFASCTAELPSDKVILLDAASDVASRRIDSLLFDGLVEDVGRVNDFHSGSYEDSAEWFESVYSNEKVTGLSNRAFLVYVKTSADAISANQGIKDRMVVHYLQGSAVSESFANAVGLSLAGLSGKVYYNSAEEIKVGTVPESYRFNTDVVYEANNATSPSIVYLACAEQLPVCKENLQVPAVFVEVIDANDGFSAYQGHEEIIAKSIKDGVLNFVRGRQVPASETPKSEGSLFQ